MVCAAECEVAEEQSDDETHTLQVPERSEGKTKEIRKELTFYGIETKTLPQYHQGYRQVATAPTIYSIETHKQYPKGFVQFYVATALTVYGIETK